MKTTHAKIAIITTSHGHMGIRSDAEATGLWSEEFTAPYYTFSDAGMTVDVYSVSGGEVPIDPRSINSKGENEESIERYLADTRVQDMLAHSRPINELNAEDYDAIFLPGGHGVMWDFHPNGELADIVSAMLQSDKVVGSVCHGPAGLLGATARAQTSLLQGRRLTGFSNSEERASGFEGVVPFALETQLRDAGASYSSGKDFEPYTVVDHNLVTGQNPASSHRVAQSLVEVLQAKTDKQTMAAAS